MHDYRQIGQMLVERGKVTEEQLNSALTIRRGNRRRIGEVLTDLGLVEEIDVAECLSEQFGLELIDASTIITNPVALSIISKEVALDYRILPVRYTWDTISCVVADPLDFPTSDMIARVSGRKVVLQLAPATPLIVAIMRAYNMVHGHTEIPQPRRKRTVTIKRQKDRESLLADLSNMA